LLKVRTDIAVSTGASATCIDMELNGVSDSYVHLVLNDHVMKVAT